MQVEKAIEKAGGVREVSSRLGITHQAIYKWMRDGYIPHKRIADVAYMAGVNPERLRRPL